MSMNENMSARMKTTFSFSLSLTLALSTLIPSPSFSLSLSLSLSPPAYLRVVLLQELLSRLVAGIDGEKFRERLDRFVVEVSVELDSRSPVACLDVARVDLKGESEVVEAVFGLFLLVPADRHIHVANLALLVVALGLLRRFREGVVELEERLRFPIKS